MHANNEFLGSLQIGTPVYNKVMDEAIALCDRYISDFETLIKATEDGMVEHMAMAMVFHYIKCFGGRIDMLNAIQEWESLEYDLYWRGDIKDYRRWNALYWKDIYAWLISMKDEMRVARDSLRSNGKYLINYLRHETNNAMLGNQPRKLGVFFELIDMTYNGYDWRHIAARIYVEATQAYQLGFDVVLEDTQTK